MRVVLYLHNALTLDRFGKRKRRLVLRLILPCPLRDQVEFQKLILPLAADIVLLTDDIARIIIQIDRLVAVGKLLEPDLHRGF